MRRAIGAGLGVLATAAIAAGLGMQLAPVAPASVTACATEDQTTPCHWDAQKQGNGQGHSFTVEEGGIIRFDPVTREQAYDAYSRAYAGNGCRADFEANYLGTRFVADLPKALADDLRWQQGEIGDPAIADAGYLAKEGSAITIPAQPDQVVLVAPYDGACEAR